MQVTEEQRRALFDRVRAHLDEETARLLMEVTVPANVALATRSDVQELRAEMLLRFTELEGRLTAQLRGLEQRMTSLERRVTSLDGRMDALEQRMTSIEQRMDALEQRMTSIEQRMDALEQRVGSLDGRIAGVAKDVTDTLYRRVIPAIGVMLAVATWVALVAG
jgi:chromosome segregation ATPase